MYEDTYNQKEILQKQFSLHVTRWRFLFLCLCGTYMGGLQMRAHAWGSQSRGCWLYFSNSVLLPWDRVSRWTRSSHFCLGKLANELSASAPSFSMLGLQAGKATLSSFLRLCWGFELRSSWWQSNSLSPLSNLSSPHFLFLFIKNKFISWWISGSISGLPPTGWKLQLCVEEFVRADGKKRHFTLIRSNLPACLWRKAEIMFLLERISNFFLCVLDLAPRWGMRLWSAKSWGAIIFVQIRYHQKWMDIFQKAFDSCNSETINQQDDESLKTHNTYNNQQKCCRNERKMKLSSITQWGDSLQSQQSALRLCILLRLIASIQDVFESETKA